MAGSTSSDESADMAQNCIFCKIARGEIPSRKVYEDDKVLCVMDIFPSAKGHLLILPKEHYPFLPLVPVPVASQMFKLTAELSKALKSAMITDKSTFFIANGAIAGQQSPHFLFHLIPREKNDGLDNFQIPSRELSTAETDNMAVLLSQRLGALLGSSTSPPPKKQAQGVAQSQKKDLAQVIYENPELKELIMNNPDALKKQIETNPELMSLFHGVDIDKLSQNLRSVASKEGKN